MAARSVSLETVFRWIPGAFALFRRNAAAFLGASLLTLLAFVAMMAPLGVVLAIGMKKQVEGGMAALAPFGDMSRILVAYAAMLALMLVFVPPLLVGWMRLCRDVDARRAVRAVDVLRPYGDGATWARAIGFALLAGLLYCIVFGVLAFAFQGPFTEMMHAEMQALSGTPVPPHFSAGLLLAYLLMMACGFVLQVAYGIGVAEVALRAGSPLGALRLGLGATLRNLGKLVVMLFVLVVGFGIAWFALVLVVVVLVVVLSLVSHVLAAVVAGLVYLGLLACVYPLMFSGQYLAWKDMVGGEDAPGEPAGALSA
jgi:hypothetical protein